MFDFGKNKNKSKSGDDKSLDYSCPQQDEASEFVHNKSRESLKSFGAWGRAGIKSEVKDFVDLQTALAEAELAELHPHMDVIELAMKKIEDLRNGVLNGLSEDEKEIAEQAK